VTAAALFDPACVTVTTAQQLLARHSRMDGDNFRCGRCAGTWPCLPAMNAAEVCRAAGITVPSSLGDEFTPVNVGSAVHEVTQRLALLEDLPRRRPGRALSAVTERRVGVPR
jgi:hypothetical protein